MRGLTIAVAAATAQALFASAALAAPKVGKPAPDFRVETFDGQTLQLSDFRGKVVILNFWATWCAPCRAELPLLDGYYRVRKDAGLEVLAIATEGSVPASKLKPLSVLVAFPFVRRLHGPYGPIGRAIPTNYVIDRAGVVRYAKAASFDLDDLNKLLIPLLNEPAPPSAEPAALASAAP